MAETECGHSIATWIGNPGDLWFDLQCNECKKIIGQSYDPFVMGQTIKLTPDVRGIIAGLESYGLI